MLLVVANQDIFREDPGEEHDLISDPERSGRVDIWRHRLVDQLRGRPEGFVERDTLVPGREHSPALEHAGTPDPTWRGWNRP